MPHHNPYLVVIAGGSGTRFWPKSTSKKPKQLLSFGNSTESLLEQTLARFDGLVPPSRRLIVTTQALESAIADLKTPSVILGEPQGRNTAASIYWAARHIGAIDPDAVMMVMPADHMIADVPTFRAVVESAVEWAAQHNDLVTLGVKATRPETGYGYLKVDSKGLPHKVEEFVEKPSLERAEEFLKAGNYLWNGGMFVWRNDVILAAFDRYMPEFAGAWDASGGKVEKAFPLMTATSIDYGVMEKANNVVTFPLDCGWNDVGSWVSLEEVAHQLDAKKGANVVVGGEIFSLDSSGNIVDAPGKFVAMLGVNDLIVVENQGTVMIAQKSRAQEIKTLVEALKRERPELV